ncbi:hypothetical protein BCR44DRAFT_1391259, partial [Catenaria anguillulae PL171]
MHDPAYDFESGSFDIHAYYHQSPQNFVHDYRFLANDFMDLPTKLGMAPIIILPNGRRFDNQFAMAVTLHRLGKATDEYTSSRLFGIDRSTINRVTNHVLTWIDSKYGSRMYLGPHVCGPDRIQAFSDAIRRKGAQSLLLNHQRRRIIGFVDGTFRPTARPVIDQRLVYSGYYRAHGLKYQGVVM